jgi:NarL family two-component system sensor histidine kinase LiaS
MNVKLPLLMRGLRWRLTISYVLVTVTAALAMSVTSAIVQTADGQGRGGTPGAADVLPKSAAQASPYLSGTHPSPDTVDVSVALPTFAELSRQFPGHTLAVAVLDADGRLLDATNCTPQPPSGAAPAQCQAAARAHLGPLLDDPTVTAAITAAATPASQGTVGTGSVGEHGFVVASVPGSSKQPAGALLAMFAGSPPAGHPASPLAAFLTQWRVTASPTWLPLLFAILILGTATGLLLSGRLIRRLQAMASTVRVWSRGDLTSSADTYGHDELSGLAADLNHMAEQLRNLLAARKDIAKAEERHHVRRELHDGVKQELFAAAMHLAAASGSLNGTNSEAIAHLADARRSAERAQGELTAIINEQPPVGCQNWRVASDQGVCGSR